MTVPELFAEIAAHHTFAPPLPDARRAALEAALDLPLPEDSRTFYGLCNGATLVRGAG